jgi:membrane fusion protein (multidrug efflux system)
MSKRNIIIIVILCVIWGSFLIWASLETAKFSKREKVKKQTPKEETKVDKKSLLAGRGEELPIMVRAFKVKRTDFTDTLPVMGTIKGESEIPLKFEINGIIKRIYFREGELIKKGDLIATLDPKDAQIRLDYAKNKLLSAEAAYRASQRKLEVYKDLFAANAIIRAKLEEIEAETEVTGHQVEAVQSEKQLAEEDLKKTYLYATKEGFMGPRESDEGAFVTPQDKIGSLLSTEKVFAEIGIVERDIDKVKAGQKARVYVDAYPQIAFEGVVDRVFPVVEGKSRTLTARIKVKNSESLLLPGMFARGEILLKELNDALLVPPVALIKTGEDQFLLPVIPKDTLTTDGNLETGKVFLYQVEVGYITSDFAEIKSGLHEGDYVVTEAQGKLKDKATVKIIGTEELQF